MKFTKSVTAGGNYLVFNLYGIVVFAATFSGGFPNPNLIWLGTIPIMAVCLTGKKSGYFWISMCVTALITYFVLYKKDYQLPGHFTPEDSAVVFFAMSLGLVLVTGMFSMIYENLKENMLLTLDMQRTNSVQGAKMAALGEMAAGIAHEINNPLAIIQMSCEQLNLKLKQKNESDDDFVAKKVDLIEKTVKRIAKIIQGLRYFSRDASADKFIAESVESIVNETLAFCVERFKTKGIKLEFETPAKDLKVQCRPTQISQALLNLLNNALDATLMTDSSDKWVKIKVSDEGEMVVLYVIDNGPGVPAAIKEKIFEPFFSTKELGKGTGLGLSISKGLLEANSGSLNLVSGAVNTTFKLSVMKAK